MLGVVVDAAPVVVSRLGPWAAHEVDQVWPSEPAFRQPLDPVQLEVGFKVDVEVGSVRGQTQIESCLLDGGPGRPGTLPRLFGHRGPGGLKHVELVTPPTPER